MFSHVLLGTNDVQTSKQFYDAVLGALGHQPGTLDGDGRCLYLTEAGIFGVTPPINGEPATHGNGSTIGFTAASEEAVNAWHAAGLANGGVSCENPPGERATGVYLAYLRDPSGNKICAMHRPA